MMSQLETVAFFILQALHYSKYSAFGRIPAPYPRVPSATDGNTTLNICIILERNSTSLAANYDRLAASIDLALIYVKEEVLVNTGIVFDTLYRNAGSKCEVSTVAAMAAMELFVTGVHCDVFLGPGCRDSASDIYNIATYSKMPIFAIPAGGIVTAAVPRNLFPQMIRMSYQATSIGAVLVGILKHLQFRHSFCIVDTSVSFYQLVGDALFDQFRIHEPDLLRYSDFVYLDAGDSDLAAVTLTYLENAQESARAIILLTNGLLTRQIMLLAREIGMTSGDYIYIAAEPFESQSWGVLTIYGDDGRDDEARQAFTSLVVVALADRAGPYWDSFGSSFSVLAQSPPYDYNFTRDGKVSHVLDPMVVAYFDAVVLYASAVRAVHLDKLSVKNPILVLGAMKNCVYHSPVTEEIIMDVNGDRVVNYTLNQFSRNGQYDIIMSFSSTGSLVGHGEIPWPTGVLPVDVPLCGFLGKDPKCVPKSNIGAIVGGVVTALGVVGAAIVAWIYRHRSEQDDPYWWRIPYEELDFGSETTGNEGETTAVVVSSDRRHVGKAELRGLHLAVIELPEKTYLPTEALLQELEVVRFISHANLCRIIGVCLDDQSYCLYVLEELCEKGALADLMSNDAVGLDDAFKNSFMRDIVEGVAFLHSNAIGSHGFLTSACCMVNGKFMAKIDDYGITQFRGPEIFLPPKISDTLTRELNICLWRAPELLRVVMPVNGSQKGDVYSFGIVMQEIVCRSAPYLMPLGLRGVDPSDLKHLIMEVKRGSIPPFRPKVPVTACHPDVYEVMQRCLEEEPEDRPTFAVLRDSVKKFKIGGHSIVDHLLRKMEDYSQALEIEVTRKTEQFKAEKARSDKLLKNMLPKATAEALTKGETIGPESFSSVTISFSDIPGFGELCSRISPLAVLEALNCLYLWSDGIMDSYDVYKVEAIDDIFMIASGLPVRNGNRHVTIMANLALHLMREVTSIKIPNQSTLDLKIRIGMFTGPCVAGIVGLKMPRYCLFGDSVNTASRMQSHGEGCTSALYPCDLSLIPFFLSTPKVGKIHLAPSTAELLQEIGGYIVEKRGDMEIKGKGLMTTFWLKSVGEEYHVNYTNYT